MKPEVVRDLRKTQIGRSCLYTNQILHKPTVHDYGLGQLMVIKEGERYPFSLQTCGFDALIGRDLTSASIFQRRTLVDPFSNTLRAVENNMREGQVSVVASKSAERPLGDWNGELGGYLDDDKSLPIHLRLMHQMIDLLTESGLLAQPSLAVVTWAGIVETLNDTKFKGNYVLAAQVLPGRDSGSQVSVSDLWSETLAGCNAEGCRDTGSVARLKVEVLSNTHYVVAINAGINGKARNQDILYEVASNLKLQAMSVI